LSTLSKIDIRLKEISHVFPHEETIKALSSHLARRIKAEEAQRDPVIADSASGVVLDGMHRLEALRELNATLVVCYFVDYPSPDIKVGRWLRQVKRVSGSDVKKIATYLGLSDVVPLKEGIRLTEEKKTAAALVDSGKAYVSFSESSTSQDTNTLVKAFDKMAAELGYHVSFLKKNSSVMLSIPIQALSFSETG
jgi:hypothetical protein